MQSATDNPNRIGTAPGTGTGTVNLPATPAIGIDPDRIIEQNNWLREIAVQLSRIPVVLGELRGDIQNLTEKLADAMAMSDDE